MATRNIYRKICPSCSASVETDAKQCGCGYSFIDTVASDDAFLAEDQAVQEEELLKEYLDARVAQAMSELEVLQTSMSGDPKNLEKANELMRAFAQVRELRHQREVQQAKIAEVKKTAHAARVQRGLAKDLAEELIKEISTAVASTEPSIEFRAAQTAKAESIMRAAGIDTKICPKCRTALPTPAALCFCGFAFTRAGSGASHGATTSAPPQTDSSRAKPSG